MPSSISEEPLLDLRQRQGLVTHDQNHSHRLPRTRSRRLSVADPANAAEPATRRHVRRQADRRPHPPGAVATTACNRGEHREVTSTSRVRGSLRQTPPFGRRSHGLERSSARLRIEKHPGGTGSRRGSSEVDSMRGGPLAHDLQPARVASSVAPPMIRRADRAHREAPAHLALDRLVADLECRVDKSVWIRLRRPHGRSTRTSSATTRVGVGEPLRGASRAASKEPSGSTRKPWASPNE